MKKEEKVMLYNWEIQEKPLYRQIPTDFVQETDAMIPLEGYKVLCRGDNQQVLNVVKDSYVPVTNEAFEGIISTFERADCEVLKHGEFKDGGILWVEMSNDLLPNMTIGGDDDDVVENHITLLNSHNGMYSLQMLLTTIRLACMNQFAFMMKKGQTMFDKIRHTKSMPGRVEALQYSITSLSEAMHDVHATFNQMADTPVSTTEAPELFQKILNLQKKPRKQNNVWTLPQFSTRGINQLDELANKYYISGAEGNRWGVFNAVTDYAKKYDSTLYGAGLNLRQRAYSILAA